MSPSLIFVGTVIKRDWQFLSVTMTSCAVAAIVAMFQYSVFTSFLRAGAVIPRAVGADFWVTARTVECFDFPDPISQDFAPTMARYVPNARFRRVVFGFAPWRSPTGRRGNVAVVGIDDSGLPQNGFAADQSDLVRLDIPSGGKNYVEASIADTTLHHSQIVDTLPTFLGAPYIVVPFETGRQMLRMDPNSTSFLIGNFGEGDAASFKRNIALADAEFPEVSLISGRDFEASSSRYWQHKTGAGAAILLAAILAALLMMILLANGISRFIQRYNQDLLSLLGHGASEREIGRIIAMVAIVIAMVTSIAAVLVTPIAILIAKPLLPWVLFRMTDALLPLLALVAAAGFAILNSRRAVAAFSPDVVFRS